MRPGRRLALDIGKVRIGVAVSDIAGILASPREAIARSSESEDYLDRILAIASELEVFEIYVGNPLSLSGEISPSTQDANEVARKLAHLTDLPVLLIDERLTTVSAASKLRQSGFNSKQAKSLIDSASAVEILEAALRFEKNQGASPGQAIGENGPQN